MIAAEIRDSNPDLGFQPQKVGTRGSHHTRRPRQNVAIFTQYISWLFAQMLKSTWQIFAGEAWYGSLGEHNQSGDLDIRKRLCPLSLGKPEQSAPWVHRDEGLKVREVSGTGHRRPGKPQGLSAVKGTGYWSGSRPHSRSDNQTLSPLPSAASTFLLQPFYFSVKCCTFTEIQIGMLEGDSLLFVMCLRLYHLRLNQPHSTYSQPTRLFTVYDESKKVSCDPCFLSRRRRKQFIGYIEQVKLVASAAVLRVNKQISA
ncbi:hypothetical protein RRG08_060197 [Elysia crispata]|uniref:Uncharacterized protein n=1 Tax=Elysia crispata TaxID=231223 RepID=A0AAE1A0H4_9GAST|nr:hypothetical protein RRG08_060197 [Elysia crispata]